MHAACTLIMYTEYYYYTQNYPCIYVDFVWPASCITLRAHACVRGINHVTFS